MLLNYSEKKQMELIQKHEEKICWCEGITVMRNGKLFFGGNH
jgi:hypothetical protein